MDFKRFFKNLYSRCYGIIVSPRVEWIKIKEEKRTFLQLISGFLLPLLILASAASMIGNYLKITGIGFTPEILLVSGLKPFLSILISILLSIMAVNAMLKTFGGTANFTRVAKLVVFSFVPGLLVTIILGLVPWFYILGLFFLYSFYIFFHGTPVLLDIPAEKQSNFSTLSSATVMVIYLMISFILSSFFGAIQ